MSKERLEKHDINRSIVWLVVVVLVMEVLGATVLKRVLWGTHAYGFFPSHWLGWALATTLIALVCILAFPEAPEAELDQLRGSRWLDLLPAAAAFALFWTFRIGHTLLGDAAPLSQHLPLGEHSHPRQPLTMFLHQAFYTLTRSLFDNSAHQPAAIAADTVALGSSIAGALFVLVVMALARELTTATSLGGRSTQVPPALVAALILTQGYAQLFFGYIENYTYFSVAIALYLLWSIRFLNARAPLIASGLAFVVALGLNLSGVILVPSFLFLVMRGVRFRPVRAPTLRDLVAVAILLVLLDRVLVLLGNEHGARDGLREMWYRVVRGEGGPGIRYLFSADHLRDFVNLHLLIGPFAALLLIPVSIHWAIRPPGRPVALFLLMGAYPPLLASWMFGDPPLGFPRDWDLFAPFAILYVTAAAFCLLSSQQTNRTLRRMMAAAVVVSLFHLVPWIALNTSEARALKRWEFLPPSHGRYEFYVAHWQLAHNNREQAREWLWRAVGANPAHGEANYYLGLFAVDEGRYEGAIRHFRVAALARPDLTKYRLALVDALVLNADPQSAVPELEALVHADSTEARYWACYGVVLTGLAQLPQFVEGFGDFRACRGSK